MQDSYGVIRNAPYGNTHFTLDTWHFDTWHFDTPNLTLPNRRNVVP